MQLHPLLTDPHCPTLQSQFFFTLRGRVVAGMEAIIINVWPTKSTPDIIQPVPFTATMSVSRAVDLLRIVRDIPQPTNMPLPPIAVLQFPRYYLIQFDGYLTIRGVKRNLQPTKWYAVFDVNSVVDHGYWHPSIVDKLLAVLEPLAK